MAASKLAKHPVVFLPTVSLSIVDSSILSVVGSCASGTLVIPDCVTLSIGDGTCAISLKSGFGSRFDCSMLGTFIAKLKQLVSDCVHPKKITLQMIGVGFKAFLASTPSGSGSVLACNTRKSHLDAVVIPSNISVSVRDSTKIDISGSTENVTLFACDVMRFRRWDPCRQNGIVIEGTALRRKEGKKK